MGKKKTLQELVAEMNERLDKHAEEADKLADPMLNSITEQVDELSVIFDNLKLTDPETYSALKKIVNAETRKNIAIANIVERVKALGEAGAKAVNGISKLTGAGALAALGSALGKRK